jgi:hypothetical protein
VNGMSANIEINSTLLRIRTVSQNNVLNLVLPLPLYFRQLTVMSTAKQNFICRMFQEKIPSLRDNISCFNLHRYEQTHLYPSSQSPTNALAISCSPYKTYNYVKYIKI